MANIIRSRAQCGPITISSRLNCISIIIARLLKRRLIKGMIGLAERDEAAGADWAETSAALTVFGGFLEVFEGDEAGFDGFFFYGFELLKVRVCVECVAFDLAGPAIEAQ